MDNREIGRFISTIRKGMDMTQNDLAEKLGVTNKAISKWETGEGYPEITLVPSLAKELGISIDELLSANLNEESDTYIGTLLPLHERYRELTRHMNMHSLAIAFNLIGLGAFVYFHTWSWNLSLIGYFIMLGFGLCSLFLLYSSYGSIIKVRFDHPEKGSGHMGKYIHRMFLTRISVIIMFIAATMPFVASVWSKPYASHLAYLIWLFVTIPAGLASIIILKRNVPVPDM